MSCCGLTNCMGGFLYRNCPGCAGHQPRSRSTICKTCEGFGFTRLPCDRCQPAEATANSGQTTMIRSSSRSSRDSQGGGAAGGGGKKDFDSNTDGRGGGGGNDGLGVDGPTTL